MADLQTPPAAAGGETVSASAPIVTNAMAPSIIAAPNPASAPLPGFRFGTAHLAGVGGIGYALSVELKPLVDWAAHGGLPSESAEGSLATLVGLAVAAAAVWFTRGRAGLAAYITGDDNATTSNS